MSGDPWAVLELEPGSSEAEIKSAYRRLARQWHPDRNPAPEAEARMVAISSAYELLMDPRRRAMHTRVGRGRGAGAPPLEFLQDFTDAVERAERLVMEWAVARALRRSRRGRGAELAARLALELVDGVDLLEGGDPGAWARFRARRRLRTVRVVIDYRSRGPASKVRGAGGRWEIHLCPGCFWEEGLREPADLDRAVTQHVGAQLVAILAEEAGVRWLILQGGESMLRRAREVDDAWLRARRIRWAVWLAVGGLSAAMLIAGYLSRFPA